MDTELKAQIIKENQIKPTAYNKNESLKIEKDLVFKRIIELYSNSKNDIENKDVVFKSIVDNWETAVAYNNSMYKHNGNRICF